LSQNRANLIVLCLVLFLGCFDQEDEEENEAEDDLQLRLGRIADLQSAERRILLALFEFSCPAECNSAIRQIENLRYEL
jgi:hypothetical protein